MFIALQVIDLDTGEVLGYMRPNYRFAKNLTGHWVYIKTKSRVNKLINFATEFCLEIRTNKGWLWDHWREKLNTKEHPFIQLRLVEYKLEEVSNTMLVQVLLKDSK